MVLGRFADLVFLLLRLSFRRVQSIGIDLASGSGGGCDVGVVNLIVLEEVHVQELRFASKVALDLHVLRGSGCVGGSVSC